MATTAKFWGMQFSDADGNAYAGVKVYHYTSGTATDKDAWVDAGKSATAQQPVQGDSRGMASFYGDGVYRLLVTTNDGIALYDWQDVDVSGRTTGTATRIPYFAASGALTEDDDLTYDETNHRLGIGTHTNITERIVMPTNSYLGAERSTASSGEGARKVIGLDSSDHVAIDPDGQGINLSPRTGNTVLYLDSSGMLQTLTLPSGYLIIGSSGAAPQVAQLSAGSGIAIANTAGSITVTATGASVINRTTSFTAISGTLAETTFHSFSIPGNTLSTNKAIRITILADYLNDSGAVRTLIVKFKYGATTMWADTSPTFNNSANRRVVFIDLLLAAAGTTNAQMLGGMINVGEDIAATTGEGDLGSGTSTDMALVPIFGSATEDSTIDRTFTVTTTHSAANANLEIAGKYANAVLL